LRSYRRFPCATEEACSEDAVQLGTWRKEARGGSSEEAYLAGFVLCDFMLGVLLALFALAVGAAGLWDVDLIRRIAISRDDNQCYNRLEVCTSRCRRSALETASFRRSLNAWVPIPK